METSRRDWSGSTGDPGLKKVPETLREVRDIHTLSLNDNEIQELPQWIGELSDLFIIDLDRNHLRTLPPEIGSLPRLGSLYLTRNRSETLPETLRQLPLRYLKLHSNPALDLPDSILNRSPKEILRYYFESRKEKGRPLLKQKLLLVGRGRVSGEDHVGEAPCWRGAGCA
jgi:Leucine-rich repeat (LRR) protein